MKGLGRSILCASGPRAEMLEPAGWVHRSRFRQPRGLGLGFKV